MAQEMAESRLSRAARKIRDVFHKLKPDKLARRAKMGRRKLTVQLIHSVIDGEESEARRLLKQGADVEARGNTLGITPLRLAAFYGFTGVCRLLIEHGADVTAKDPKGKTALMQTMGTGHAETAMFLKAAEQLNEMMGRESLGPFMSNFNECVKQ